MLFEENKLSVETLINKSVPSSEKYTKKVFDRRIYQHEVTQQDACNGSLKISVVFSSFCSHGRGPFVTTAHDAIDQW